MGCCFVIYIVCYLTFTCVLGLKFLSLGGAEPLMGFCYYCCVLFALGGIAPLMGFCTIVEECSPLVGQYPWWVICYDCCEIITVTGSVPFIVCVYFSLFITGILMCFTHCCLRCNGIVVCFFIVLQSPVIFVLLLFVICFLFLSVFLSFRYFCYRFLVHKFSDVAWGHLLIGQTEDYSHCFQGPWYVFQLHEDVQ